MQRWTVQLDGGPRRVNHAAVVCGSRIFTFGGYCTGDDYETTRPMDVHVLNTISLRWKALPVPSPSDPHFALTPYQRYGHTATGVGDVAYVWGGRNDRDGACNTLFCFHTASNTWSMPAVKGEKPGARDGHSACLINGKIYIFGGYEQGVDKFSNEVHCLDLAAMTWELLRCRGKPARWRDFHSATGLGSQMFVYGGRSDRAGPYHTSNELYCHQLHVFDTSTHTWSQPHTPGVMPIGRRSHSAFVYDDELYIFGGYNGLHDVHLADMYKYSPKSSEWSVVKVGGHGPCPRRRQCCCVIQQRVFLFGGTCPCQEPAEDSEYDLMDHSDLHVLDFAPSLKTLSMLVVIAESLDTAGLPADVRWELTAMTTNNNISRPINTSG